MHLWLLTLAMLLAMLFPPLRDDGVERQRIAIPVQIIFLVVIAAYVVAMALIGGAVLARYMLPAVPLVIILAVSTLRRRLPYLAGGCGCDRAGICGGLVLESALRIFAGRQSRLPRLRHPA